MEWNSKAGSVLRKLPNLYAFDSDLRNRLSGRIAASSERGRRHLHDIVAKNRIIIVLFTNRSGSNLVTDMLDHMGVGGGATNEPFLPDVVEHLSTARSNSSMDEYICGLIEDLKRNHTCFLKMSWDAAFWLTSEGIFDGLLDQFAFIRTTREDKLLQAISFLKATHTGTFFQLGSDTSERDTSPASTWEDAIMPEDILQALHYMYISDYRLKYFLTINGIDACEIVYEEMAGDLTGAYEKIAKYLGIEELAEPAGPYVPKLQRQLSGQEYVVKERFLDLFKFRPPANR